MSTLSQNIKDGVESVKAGQVWMKKTFPRTTASLQECYEDWAGEYPMSQDILTGVAKELNLSPAREWRSREYDQDCIELANFN